MVSAYNFWSMDNRKLCEAPYNKTVDWAKWYIFWADERVVAKSHADSNYKLAKDNLLSKVCTNVSLLLVIDRCLLFWTFFCGGGGWGGWWGW